MKRRAKAAVLAFALAAPAAMAQQGEAVLDAPPPAPQSPREAVEDRQAAMMLMWYAAETMGTMLRGGSVDDRRARNAARTLDEVSAKILTYFPEDTGSGVDDSKAVADIWTEWSRMQDHARQLRSGVAALREAVDSGAGPDALIPPFREMGYACGSCHYDFRLGQDLLATD